MGGSNGLQAWESPSVCAHIHVNPADLPLARFSSLRLPGPCSGRCPTATTAGGRGARPAPLPVEIGLTIGSRRDCGSLDREVLFLLIVHRLT